MSLVLALLCVAARPKATQEPTGFCCVLHWVSCIGFLLGPKATAKPTDVFGSAVALGRAATQSNARTKGNHWFQRCLPSVIPQDPRNPKYFLGFLLVKPLLQRYRPDFGRGSTNRELATTGAPKIIPPPLWVVASMCVAPPTVGTFVNPLIITGIPGYNDLIIMELLRAGAGAHSSLTVN